MTIIDALKTTFSRTIFISVISFATSVLIARIYGPEGNGTISIALLLPLFLTQFLDLGLTPANTYLIAKERYSHIDVKQRLLPLFVLILISGSIIGSAIIWFFGHKIFPGIPTNILYLSLVLFPISITRNIVLSAYHGLQDFKTINRSYSLQAAGYLALVILLLIYDTPDIKYVLGANIASQLLNAIYLLHQWRNIPPRLSQKLPSNYVTSALRYGVPAQSSNLLTFANYRLDLFMVNFYVSPASAGIYAISTTLVEKIWVASTVASTVMFPKQSSELDEQKKTEITILSAQLIAVLALVSGMTLAIIAEPFIFYVFGSLYLSSVSLIYVLLPGVTCFSVSRILANDLASRGLPKYNLYIAVVQLFINVVLNIILIPKFGIVGAALATSIAYFVDTVLRIILFCRIAKTKIANLGNFSTSLKFMKNLVKQKIRNKQASNG